MKVIKSYDTAGNPIYRLPDFCECGLTGGCQKCNPFQEFWEEDIKMAEVGMIEYNEILLEEDEEYIFPESREGEFLSKDLQEFYKKKGYKIRI